MTCQCQVTTQPLERGMQMILSVAHCRVWGLQHSSLAVVYGTGCEGMPQADLLSMEAVVKQLIHYPSIECKHHRPHVPPLQPYVLTTWQCS